jgi:hypothetical protein
LVGVATVGRPVARHMDDGLTAEVTRTCTTGVSNANSKLYGAAWRAARGMGYQRLITYTHDGETGASLRAAGLVPVAPLRARPGWTTSSRPRPLTASTTFAGYAGKFAPGFPVELDAGLHEQVTASAYVYEPLQRSCFSWYSWQKVNGAAAFA